MTSDAAQPPLFAEARGVAKTPVVLLHGFGGCGAMWEPVLDRMPAGIASLAYDLPGCGRSLHVAAGGAAKIAAAILADLSRRGIARVHLVGHSLGGAVATLAALAAPERVASLTLLAPGGFGEEIDGGLLARYAAARSQAEIAAALVAMSAPGHRPPARLVETMGEMRAVPGQTEILQAGVSRLTRGGRQGVIPHESLAALAMPVAVAWGTADPVLPYAQTAGLPPSFRLETIAGAGHMLIEEAPGRIATLIGETVARAG